MLQGLRFRALEANTEAKETARRLHDNTRGPTFRSKGANDRTIGDIVSVSKPQTKLPKLNFTWTEPVFIITHVTPSNVSVRNLAGGGKDISSRQPEIKDDMVVNRKMTSLYPVSSEYFVGAKVRKRFSSGWSTGTVDWVDTDEGETLWHVTYTDFDSEQMTKAELSKAIVYHPLLDATGDIEVPKMGTYVWYSMDQQPRLGKVVSVDPTVSRPVVVEVQVPQAGASNIAKAKFIPAKDYDSESTRVERLTLHQILLSMDHLTPKGYLTGKDRDRLMACLER